MLCCLPKFIFRYYLAPVLKGRPRKKRTTKDLTCKVQERGGKYRRKIETISQDNVVGRPPLPESDSSDENQTDTSEDSTVGSHELPCPPKLVSSVNEVKEEKDEKMGLAETNQGVIRAVKQSSLVEVKPTAIPPVPKLVKIEPKPEAKVYESFRRPVPESTPVSVCCMENNIMTSSTKASVISSTYHADGAIQKSPYRPITMPTHENARIPHETQSEEAKTRTSSDVLLAASLTKDKLANVPVSVSSNNRTLLSHAGTISTNRHIQSRISAIVSTSKEKATRSLVATSPSELGTERHLECRNDLKQTFKRKRGRPPGKSTKYLKVQDMKLADQTPTRVNPLPQVEIDVSRVQVKTELITSLAEESIADDIQSSVEV